MINYYDDELLRHSTVRLSSFLLYFVIGPQGTEYSSIASSQGTPNFPINITNFPLLLQGIGGKQVQGLQAIMINY